MMLIGAYSPAHAKVPDELCGRARFTSGAETPEASTVLANAATALEAELARYNGANSAEQRSVQVLNVELPAHAAVSANALATYCSAAGEFERVGRAGSPLRARAFLLTAFTEAESARLPDVAARASYRLGFLAAASVGIAGSRGGGQRAPAARARLIAPAIDPCASLDSTSIFESDTSALALDCAVRRAAAAGDAELAGLASLRLARLRLAGAQIALRGVFPSQNPVDRAASRGLSTQPSDGIEDKGDSAALRALAARSAISGLAFVSSVRDPNVRIELTGRLADTAIEASRPDDPSVTAASRGIQRAYPNDPGAQAYAAAVLGRVALATGDRARARELIERAIFFESQRERPTRLADWYLLMAQAAPERRAGYALDAYRALTSVRVFLPVRDPLTEESTFQLHMRKVFEAAADAALSPEGGKADIAGAQGIVEDAREAEIQSAFGAECIPPIRPIRPHELRKGEIVLYPVLLEDRVELLYAAGGEGEGFHRLAPNRDLDRDKVATLIERMRVSAINQDEAWKGPSSELYDLLIAPIESRLGPDTTLVIMPDGPLRALPFAALIDGHGQFLVERTRLGVAPALAYSQPGIDRAGKTMTVVAAALETEVDLPVGDFAKLGGAGDEARAARGNAGARRGALLGEDVEFTRASLRDALEVERPSVLHLATHAAFNGRSDRSFIVADDEVIPVADLRDMIDSGRRRGDALDLLVLSACETAVGDDQAGMGLAGAAVQAGVRSAIASLWSVNDESTSELMAAFYEAYRGGATKAEALRAAQLTVLGQPRYRDQPFYWAGFTLIGGWR